MKKQLSIYIVEDEVIIRNDIINAVTDAGYRVAGTAGSGEDALAEIPDSGCDLVLMDIVLDGPMNGIEAAAAINRTLQLPVIFLTTYSDDITRYRAESAGPAGYISKPFNARELREVIEGLRLT
ncbi:response regulator [bacterium]|nr:response regulator [bacterium]